jgi:hypothetical protein
VNAHYPVLVILGILFFLAFVSATRLNQHTIALRPPLLVGLFLAALIIHGGCQQWWIGPVLGGLSKWPLTLAATTPHCLQRQCSDHLPCIPCSWIF